VTITEGATSELAGLECGAGYTKDPPFVYDLLMSKDITSEKTQDKAPQEKGKKTAYVSFSAQIDPTTTESLIAQLAKLANEGVEHVYLALSTPGGSVMNGLNIYNILRAMPFEVTTHNVGNVASIGNAIFLAGDERYACPNTTFMFHGVGFDIKNQRLGERELREKLNNVLEDQKRIGAIIEERTRLTSRKAAGLFSRGQTKDTAFAVSTGIIDDIRDLKIPKGSPIYSLVFKR